MTIVSSHRPLLECSPEISRNQISANESWNRVFDSIVYFGPEEKSFKKSLFVPSDPFPRITKLVFLCSQITGWSVISNSDILVSERLPIILWRLEQHHAVCAISRRFEFTDSVKTSKVVDLGLDFFMARQEVWMEIFKIYPRECRIGHNLWDSMMLGALNIAAEAGLYDLTDEQLIFHPKHGGRKQIHEIKDSDPSECRNSVWWPRRRLK